MTSRNNVSADRPAPFPEQAPSDLPAKLFQLPYADQFYVCTCSASVRTECVCDQETIVTTCRNRHTVDPETISWLCKQNGTVSMEQAARYFGFGSEKDHGSAWTAITLRIITELMRYGCKYIRGTGFSIPAAETFVDLHRRRLADSRSRTVSPQSSSVAPDRHPELSPALRADYQSEPGDSVIDPQLPQRSA